MAKKQLQNTMTDVALLTKSAWAMIQPYLPYLGIKVVDETSKIVPQAVSKAWDAIIEKFETKAAAKNALDNMLKSHDDVDTQAAFRYYLKKLLADESFAKSLSKLLEEAGYTYTATLSGDGAIAQGEDAKAVGSGSIVIHGNVSGNILSHASGNILIGKSNINTGEKPDEVAFTAIYPKECTVDTWNTLLVYAHLLSALEDVRQDAQRFKDQIRVPKEVTSSSSTPIARGTEIAFVPTCAGIVFNPQRAVVKWMERYHRADFRFRAEKSLANDAARGEINIYVGPVLVGSLKFSMLLSETDAQTDWEEHARMYHQEDIFVSYSHKDSKVALACKKAYDALGFNVLIDVDTLRSGQVWNEELMCMIDRATIFQLFWSQNSCQSKYCRQEWEHALKQNKVGFIRPVYWQRPMPEPPEELSRYHFEYIEL